MTLEKLNDTYVFFSYAQRDKALRDQLENHLSNLKYRGLITTWHDREIRAGEERARQIDIYLNNARIILLLISAHFMASEYCYGLEMKQALARHKRGEAHVIPILLRPVLFTEAPFAELQMLPTNGKPVVKWSDRDSAFVDIACAIERIALLYKVKETQPGAHVRTYDIPQKQVFQDAIVSIPRALRFTLTISEDEALRGTTRTFTLPGGQKKTITIPPHTTDRQIFPEEYRNPDNNTEILPLWIFIAIKPATITPPSNANYSAGQQLPAYQTQKSSPYFPSSVPGIQPAPPQKAKRMPLLLAAFVVFILSFLSIGLGLFGSPSSAGNPSTGGTHPAPSSPITTIFLFVGAVLLCLALVICAAVVVLRVIRSRQRSLEHRQQERESAREMSWAMPYISLDEESQERKQYRFVPDRTNDQVQREQMQQARESQEWKRPEQDAPIQKLGRLTRETAQELDKLREQESLRQREPETTDITQKPDEQNAEFAQKRQYYEDTLKAYNRATAQKPYDSAALRGLGNTYMALQYYVAAFDAFRRTILLQPMEATAWADIGNVLAKLQQHQQAVEAYEEALRLDDEVTLDYDALVQSLMVLGRVQEAERYRERTRELGYYDE